LANLGLDSNKYIKYYNIVKKSYGVVRRSFKDNTTDHTSAEENSFVGRLIKYAGAEVISTPRVGAFFYRQRTGGGHIGIIVKIDNEQRKFWTIEGNAERADGQNGVASWEYDFDEIQPNGENYILSIRTAGEQIAKETKTYTIEDEVFTYGYDYTPYFLQTCWGDSTDNTTTENDEGGNGESDDDDTITSTEKTNPPEITENTCPNGKVKDPETGGCVENKPPLKCCDVAIRIPTDPTQIRD
jgi:hypothetical protein